jgi:alpha-glucosidase (family GH31 glycosyl hydrolase)
MSKALFCKIFTLFCFSNIWITATSFGGNLTANDSVFLLKAQHYSIRIIKKGFRYSLLKSDGTVLLKSNPKSGLELLHSDVIDSRLVSQNGKQAEFIVTNDIGVKATVNIFLFDYYFKLSVRYDDPSIKGSIIAHTQGLSPAYGLADHAGFRTPYSTELTGFKSNYFGALSDGHSSRLVSNLIVCPRQGVACINLEPRKKIISITKRSLAQGTYFTHVMPALYYFTGSVKQIYADYLKVRNQQGYGVYMPKYAWFGVGWEAFGALGWHTNHHTVTGDVDHYLNAGFPLKWMVVGSGFWPGNDPRYFATTSFGYWDSLRYPDPKAFIGHFHQEGLKFILGLRIAFIPGGPYTAEGVDKKYFIRRDGVSRLFKVGFPRTECYFLDASNPSAIAWYISLCDKWKAFGVDGYKEDLYGYETDGFPDNKLDAVNAALMDQGVYIMGRNGYVGSPMDIARFNDFNYNQDQDRGPVNGLALAYSGFPDVYPDIIGGTGLTGKRFGKIERSKIGKYLMRESVYAALNPSMSFGYGPWNLNDPGVMKVCLSAARLHDRLQDYFYSAAVRAVKTGFPYPMTPLPLAYPQDTLTYYRANERVRGYQWMIGDALMATPLYGDDYATATTRNIYLPKGTWVDYANGKTYSGPVLLKDFSLPVDKIPLFVGGTGFVVERQDRRLFGRVYPVGFSGETVFYGKDGTISSKITILSEQAGKCQVKDLTENRTVKTSYSRGAWQFILQPGHDYVIR